MQMQITINSGRNQDGSYWVDVDPGTGRVEHLTFATAREVEAAVDRFKRMVTMQLAGEIKRALRKTAVKP